MIPINVDILVIEDDLDNRDLFVFALEGEGAKVVAVETVHEALAYLERFRPDVILCDIALPDENGYFLIKFWRQREAELGLSPIPAIAVTAFVREQDKQNALAAGFDLHLAKPVDIEQVFQVIARMTGDRTGQPQASDYQSSTCMKAD